MDLQSFINFGGGIALSVMGWFARELWSAVQELRKDLAKLREELPQVYQTRDDFREDMREVKALLNAIHEKLDRKQDKT